MFLITEAKKSNKELTIFQRKWQKMALQAVNPLFRAGFWRSGQAIAVFPAIRRRSDPAIGR